MVDCWVIHHPPLDFHGAGGRGRRPWLCKHAPSSRTGADGPQAEERAIAADAHRIARVPCDEFLFFVFLAEALKKHTVCPVVKKKVPPNSKVWVSIQTVLINLEEPNRLPSPTRINSSVCLSVCLSVRTYLQIRCSAENGTGPTDSVNYSSKS